MPGAMERSLLMVDFGCVNCVELEHLSPLHLVTFVLLQVHITALMMTSSKRQTWQSDFNLVIDIRVGGAMKPTTDGHWAHLACAIWIPGLWLFIVSCSITLFFFLDCGKLVAETCLSDIKRMEPIDGLNRINKVIPQFDCEFLVWCTGMDKRCNANVFDAVFF